LSCIIGYKGGAPKILAMRENIYLPHLAKIVEVVNETPDVKTFRVQFLEKELQEQFIFKAGQFGEWSIFGVGEATFCISSSPTWQGFIECSIKRVGLVTNAFHTLSAGSIIGFRGPYGNWFPVEGMRGCNLVFVGGGIGLAPLRSLIWQCLDERGDFKEITIVYGARSVADLVYKRELEEWERREDVNFTVTVDPGGQTPEWKGKIGFVPTILEQTAPSAENAFAVVCGPPIMIKFTIPVLQKLGFEAERIITTLEMRMKCGLGKCGRCNIGHVYVCKDGPVFSWAQLQSFPQEY
jgi:NAD(P)H-flavin reductase